MGVVLRHGDKDARAYAAWAISNLSYNQPIENLCSIEGAGGRHSPKRIDKTSKGFGRFRARCAGSESTESLESRCPPDHTRKRDLEKLPLPTRCL